MIVSPSVEDPCGDKGAEEGADADAGEEGGREQLDAGEEGVRAVRAVCCTCTSMGRRAMGGPPAGR